MKNHQRNEIKVGLTVVVSVALFFLGLSIFKEWTIARAQYPLTIRFPTSAGLQTGDPVTINGVKTGKVESVTVDGNSVLVRVMIDDEYRLTSDAIAIIQMVELMGGKKVEIIQGTSERMLDPVNVIKGTVDPDIAGALGMVGRLESNMNEITQKANLLFDNLNTVVGDQQFAESVKDVTENIRILSDELRELITENKANASSIASDVVSLTRRIDTLLTETRPRLISSLERGEKALVKADTLLTDVNLFVSDIRASRGFLHKVLQDTTLNSRVDRLISKLDTLASILINGQFKTRIRL